MVQHPFKIIEPEEGTLGRQLVELLTEGGLTTEQAEQVRAELEKVGFVNFRCLQSNRIQTRATPISGNVLILETNDRIDHPKRRRLYSERLYLRKAWRVHPLAS